MQTQYSHRLKLFVSYLDSNASVIHQIQNDPNPICSLRIKLLDIDEFFIKHSGKYFCSVLSSQAQFEVITSQASYMRSLNILVDHFKKGLTSPDDSAASSDVISNKDFKVLFSNIDNVYQVEQK